jgi:hypothetical protein
VAAAAAAAAASVLVCHTHDAGDQLKGPSASNMLLPAARTILTLAGTGNIQML